MTNKDKINEYNKKYYEANKEVIKEKMEIYRDQHKEQIKESDKKYRKKNKDKRNEKFECECGGKFTHNHKSKHLKTFKHKKYIESLI